MTGAVAILALGVSSQAFAFPIFTVDPDAAFGATGGSHPGPFQSDFITGNSSTLVSTPGSPNQHGEGWVNFSSFVNAGTPVLGSDSGLNTNWQMWAEITSDLTLVSGSYSQPGSTYNVTALHANLWVDPSIDTPTIFTSATDSGGAATVNHGTDSFMIATADLIIGVASVNDLGGTGINSTNSFNLLDPLGASLFTAPFPFYNIQFDEFNNTSSGVFTDPAGKYIVLNQATGGVDFSSNVVPEPATLALLGIGLLGIGASRRRKAR